MGRWLPGSLVPGFLLLRDLNIEGVSYDYEEAVLFTLDPY